MTKPKKPVPQPTPKSRELKLEYPAGEDFNRERAIATIVAAGIATNAGTALQFSQGTWGEVALTEMVASLRATGDAVAGGSLESAERLLAAQAVSLNAIYGELARRAAMNMGEYLDATDRYLRLALKAQAQCRATLETLAAIKNPPVVFAKQANIANGPQQVNNGPAPGFPNNTRTRAHAHGITGIEQSELLEGGQHGGTFMDAGATRTTAAGHPALETVEAVNRAAHRGRKGEGKP